MIYEREKQFAQAIKVAKRHGCEAFLFGGSLFKTEPDEDGKRYPLLLSVAYEVTTQWWGALLKLDEKLERALIENHANRLGHTSLVTAEPGEDVSTIPVPCGLLCKRCGKRLGARPLWRWKSETGDGAPGWVGYHAGCWTPDIADAYEAAAMLIDQELSAHANVGDAAALLAAAARASKRPSSCNHDRETIEVPGPAGMPMKIPAQVRYGAPCQKCIDEISEHVPHSAGEMKRQVAEFVGPITPPTLDDPSQRVRDQANDPRCGAIHPTSCTTICDRPAGHEGDHDGESKFTTGERLAWRRNPGLRESTPGESCRLDTGHDGPCETGDMQEHPDGPAKQNDPAEEGWPMQDPAVAEAIGPCGATSPDYNLACERPKGHAGAHRAPDAFDPRERSRWGGEEEGENPDCDWCKCPDCEAVFERDLLIDASSTVLAGLLGKPAPVVLGAEQPPSDERQIDRAVEVARRMIGRVDAVLAAEDA